MRIYIIIAALCIIVLLRKEVSDGTQGGWCVGKSMINNNGNQWVEVNVWPSAALCRTRLLRTNMSDGTQGVSSVWASQ